MRYINRAFLLKQFENFAARIATVFAKKTEIPNKTTLINNFMTTEPGLGAADAKTVADLKAEIGEVNTKFNEVTYIYYVVYGLTVHFVKYGKVVDVSINGKLTRTLSPDDGWIPFVSLEPNMWRAYSGGRNFIEPISDYNPALFDFELNVNGELKIRSSTAELPEGELVRVNFSYMSV